MIMKDNMPGHIPHVRDLPWEKSGLKKLIWPSNSAELTAIDAIWNEMKDKIDVEIGLKFTAKMIPGPVVREWRNYAAERINHHLMLISRGIEACNTNNGENNDHSCEYTRVEHYTFGRSSCKICCM